MPGKDGTGPTGNGPIGGRKRGQGTDRGRMGGALSAGPGGNCICSSCSYKEEHIAGQPCSDRKCPRCGSVMTRE